MYNKNSLALQAHADRKKFAPYVQSVNLSLWRKRINVLLSLWEPGSKNAQVVARRGGALHSSCFFGLGPELSLLLYRGHFFFSVLAPESMPWTSLRDGTSLGRVRGIYEEPFFVASSSPASCCYSLSRRHRPALPAVNYLYGNISQ